MAVHLIKLCVGAESVTDLEDWIAERMDARRRTGKPVEQVHTTRMMPKRREEIVAGGSLYWVIRGVVQCRQRVLDLRPVVDGEGVPRCDIVLEPALNLVVPRPRGPFQGWRYLPAGEAPADLDTAAGAEAMPADMRRELAELGLI